MVLFQKKEILETEVVVDLKYPLFFSLEFKIGLTVIVVTLAHIYRLVSFIL